MTPAPRSINGYGKSGRVVVAAALIMIGVFGAYVLDPDAVIKSIGVSLAFGVFVDAFIVRLTLVPAAMALLGDRAWGLPKLARPDRPDDRHRGRGPGRRLPRRARAPRARARAEDDDGSEAESEVEEEGREPVLA